ncbi:MAG: 23S rRNA (pseudouridine(1915)-N(3))-methyltransferase RlmH, partial [Hyphomicrobium sp.]
MRVIVAAVGRLKDAERELCERYVERFDAAGRALKLGPLQISEIPESRAATAELRKTDEAQRLLKAATGAEVTIALDGGGLSLSSETFAHLVAKERDGGARTMAFLVGGPDGHADQAL